MVCGNSWLARFDCRCLFCPCLGRHRPWNSLLLCGCLIFTARGYVCFFDCCYDLLSAGQISVIRTMYLSYLHLIPTSLIIPLIFEWPINRWSLILLCCVRVLTYASCIIAGSGGSGSASAPCSIEDWSRWSPASSSILQRGLLMLLLLLILMKLVAGGCLGRDWLARVVMVLLKSCTVFAAGLPLCRKIAISRFAAHCFYRDHSCSDWRR